jgi:hypothetical protein
MSVATSIYSRLLTAYPGRVYYNHISQDVELKSTAGIILITCVSGVGESSKDLSRRLRSIYRIELIGDKDAYMTLVTLAAAVRTLLTGYTNTDIYIMDWESEIEDINDVAEVARIIQEYVVLIG